MASDLQFTIKAAHVPSYEGESIADPARALAKIEVRFPELESTDGRLFEGIVILFVREDGRVLGVVQDHPVTIDGVYLDDGQKIDAAARHVLNDAGQRALSGYDLKGIWQDSRMYALYHEAHRASQKALAAYRIQQEATQRYDDHVTHYYVPDEDGGLPAKVDGIDYLTLDENGDLADD